MLKIEPICCYKALKRPYNVFGLNNRFNVVYHFLGSVKLFFLTKIKNMKNFLSFEKFKELRVLFILETLMVLLLSMLISVNKFDVNYWDWKAFIISIGIWSLSSIIDKEKYFNLATLLGTGSFMYLFWWFVFNLPIH